MSGSQERRAPALTMASPFTGATALWGGLRIGLQTLE